MANLKRDIPGRKRKKIVPLFATDPTQSGEFRGVATVGGGPLNWAVFRHFFSLPTSEIGKIRSLRFAPMFCTLVEGSQEKGNQFYSVLL